MIETPGEPHASALPREADHPAASPQADTAAAPAGEHLPIRFSASGSEYFRIWSVNLLLTFVTLGLYLPWAKVRKLRYFYGNTWVGGHALDFHGQPRSMLRGTVLAAALLAAYTLAGQVSIVAGVVAVAIVSLVWPALNRASMRFRMANTSWRGMRFQFNGTVQEAYRALLPSMLPALVLGGLSLLGPDPTGAPADLDLETVDANASAASQLDSLTGILAIGFVLLVPLLYWLLKRYKHDHCALGDAQCRLSVRPGSIYLIFLIGLLVSAVGAMALVFGVAFGMRFFELGDLVTRKTLMLGFSILYMVFFLVIGMATMAPRLQNLLWNRTLNPEIRFESQMKTWPFIQLTLKNWLLMVLTLGLYWPFAAVAMARMKLQAVSIHTTRPVDELIGSSGRTGNHDAAADVANDFFGLDIGL